MSGVTERNTKTRDKAGTSFVSRTTGETLSIGKPWGLTGASRRLNGSIYFIGGETGCIKIGWTGQSAEQRRKDLQCGSPIKLFVLAVARGGMSVEQEYHRRFKDSRSHGEWFERTPELMAEIIRLNEAKEAA